ncbi:methyl-accepting chemotaxis protein [Kamptonema sp. UHCC 0994]|uniref:methyl-accepting chemotaxis protein n=1 Tax=Kamptonema sp. UHCC 0994 TaxID=3031329 RepID=UPI0023B8C19A|nr:methyl-accepting chemotaxis protein [Kamptonema sp. UHCC 0994]MDF0553813.1 methyl-accepting chemotaxis protein [Kamptonema sp. UHCC 0994]
MILRVSLMARQVRGYLLVGNAEGALQSFDIQQNKYLEARKGVELLIDEHPNPQQKEKFSKMMELETQFEELSKRTFRLRDEGKLQEAINTYLAESKNNLGEFDRINEEFSKIEQDSLKALSDDTERALKLINLSSIAITVIALVVTYMIFNLAKNLSSLIQQVQQSGIKITSSSTQIAASGKQLEATMTEQAVSTNQMAATVKEIAATSSQLVKTMDEVEYTSQATAQGTADSQKDLIHMEKTMRTLADATNTISSKLGIISDKANSINGIVTTITKVADQTNLLSLNAAIEAEKAGEYGTGFAVVAREIRRLADQTAVATLDIENMVKEMQGAVSTGVMEMDKFTKDVELGVEDVRNIGAKLESIIVQVQTLTPRFQQVSNSMEGQSEGANQISEGMMQLSEASSQTTQSLREINNSIRELNETAQGLRQRISGYNVG